MFPPASQDADRRRLPGLRRPVEPDPRRVRRGRRAVRARGAPERDRLRLLDHRAHARGDRPPARRSGSTGTRATSSGRTSTRSASSATSRTGSTTCDCKDAKLPARQRPQRPARLAPAVGRPAARLGLRLHRPRRRAVGGLLPRAQRDRLRRPDLGRVGGRRHGPADRRARGARRRARRCAIEPPAQPSTRPSAPRADPPPGVIGVDLINPVPSRTYDERPGPRDERGPGLFVCPACLPACLPALSACSACPFSHGTSGTV